MIIREAKTGDLEELLEIYNYEVINGISTLDLIPKDMEEWKVWFYAHNVDNHPLYVADVDNRAVGYATLSSYRPKEAYKTTVELSIYVAADQRGKGIASALMAYTLEAARAMEDVHTVVSVITAGNRASLRLHQKFGFVFCGTVREVGMKFGTYRDIEMYQLLV